MDVIQYHNRDIIQCHNKDVIQCHNMDVIQCHNKGVIQCHTGSKSNKCIGRSKLAHNNVYVSDEENGSTSIYIYSSPNAEITELQCTGCFFSEHRCGDHANSLITVMELPQS